MALPAYFSLDAQTPLVGEAIQRIHRTTGDVVSYEKFATGIDKFGRNDALGTSFETIKMGGGSDTLPTTNAITHISSSDAGDTGLATIVGHTISGGVLTRKTQTVKMAGQTKTALDTPLARADRCFNTGSVDWAGTVYVYEDDTVVAGVPSTATKVRLQGTGAPRNQSEKAQQSVAGDEYLAIVAVKGSVSTKANASVEFEFQVQEYGKVWRTRLPGWTAAFGGGVGLMPLPRALILPPNSTSRIIGKASTTNVECEAGFWGYFLRIVSSADD